MLAELLEQDHGQEAGPRPASRRSHGTGAGAWLIFSQSRQVNFSRTVSITFHCRGINSKVLVTSSPILRSRLPPQQPQAAGGVDHDTLAREMFGKGISFADAGG